MTSLLISAAKRNNNRENLIVSIACGTILAALTIAFFI